MKSERAKNSSVVAPTLQTDAERAEVVGHLGDVVLRCGEALRSRRARFAGRLLGARGGGSLLRGRARPGRPGPRP